MIHTIAIAGYRSILSLVLSLGQLNLITGANGCGKSNVYRALRLLSEISSGGLIGSLAKEGGLPSVLWAGPERPSERTKSGEVPLLGSFKRNKPIALQLGYRSDEVSYCIDVGLPVPSQSAFMLDPIIKREVVWQGSQMTSKFVIADRRKGMVNCRDSHGNWQASEDWILDYQSIITEFSEPRLAPELHTLRRQLLSWRFYDQFRTDRDSPARRMEIATRTEVMDDDGGNLAAALMTIVESGAEEELNQCINDAFPESILRFTHDRARMEVHLEQQGMLRWLSSKELSDGTLRYLLLCAALLSPRPPQLFVLNEPETSLHPDVLPALARLIERTSQRTQMIVVSHSQDLIDALSEVEHCKQFHLTKIHGATTIFGANLLDQPHWKWPPR